MNFKLLNVTLILIILIYITICNILTIKYVKINEEKIILLQEKIENLEKNIIFNLE